MIIGGLLLLLLAVCFVIAAIPVGVILTFAAVPVVLVGALLFGILI